MKIIAYLPSGGKVEDTTDRFPDLAEWKRASVAIVLDAHLPPYRYVLTDPMQGDRILWDTDDVLGVTPQDRGETAPDPQGAMLDVLKKSLDGTHPDSPIGYAEANRRQAEAARTLAAAYHSIQAFQRSLDPEDDAAAYHSLQYVLSRMGSECKGLGWPVDGAGVPLPECKDEC